MKISIYLFVVAQSSVLLVAATRRKQQKRECASPGNCGEEHLVTSRVDEHFLAADHPTCPPCAKIHCPVKRVRKLKCKGGLTVGVCNCCKTCAKVEGEECGGRHGYLGKCDVGLRCVLHSNSLDATSLPSIVISGDERRGRCVREGKSLKIISQIFSKRLLLSRIFLWHLYYRSPMPYAILKVNMRVLETSRNAASDRMR